MNVQSKNGEAIFDKTIFGGYDVEQVDEFVQESRRMLLELKNENKLLTKKLQVLADKIDEYNQTKDQAESILDNARINAADIIAVARREAEQIKAAAAKQEASEVFDKYAQEAESERARVDEMRRLKKEFCTSLIEQYKRQIDILEREISFEAEQPLQESEDKEDKKVFVVIKEQPATEKTSAKVDENSEPALSEVPADDSAEKEQKLTQEIASVISASNDESEADENEDESLLLEQDRAIDKTEDQTETVSEESQKEDDSSSPEEVLTYEEYMSRILKKTSATVQINEQPAKEDVTHQTLSTSENKKKKSSLFSKIKQMIDEIINEEEDDIDYEEEAEQEFEADRDLDKK